MRPARNRPPVALLAGLLALCTLGALAAFAAQGVGPQQRIDVAGGTAASNETTVAVSQANPNEIVAGWNDWRESPAEGEIIRAGVALSLDGGVNWTDFVLRPPAAFQTDVEGDPMAGFDPRTGNLWAGAISFGPGGGLYVARKFPGEPTFRPAVMVDTSGGIDKCWMVAGRNQLTADSTRVYIAYNFGLVRSDDFGETWTSPVSLGPGLGFLPRVGPNGELYVGYWDYQQDRFEVKRSFDGGSSFTTHLVATRMDSWGTETFNSRFPGTMRVPPLLGFDVDRTSGALYAVWPDTTDFDGGKANVDVYFSRSEDQGTSWSTPVILNGEGPFVGDQFFPWIEVAPNGALHVLYLDTRNTDQADNQLNGMIDAYHSYSEDGGDSWTESRLTPQSWNSNDDGLDRPEQFLGDYLGLAATATTAWPAYPDTQNGDTDIYTNAIGPCDPISEIADLRLGRSSDGAKVEFTWTDDPAATSYTVYQGFTASGSFIFGVGDAASGTPGLALPTPPGNRYFVVAGRNACGIGPK